MAKPLTIKISQGPGLEASLVDELWQLRVSLLTLNKSVEEDRRYFSDFICSDNSMIASFHDSAGSAQGFFSIAFFPVTHAKRKGLLMYSKYFYFNEAYRGHYKTLLAPWRILPQAFRRYGLRHLYFVTSAFPQSYVSLSRSAGNVRCLADENVTPFERHALHAFAENFFDDNWDAAAGVIRNQNTADSESLAHGVEAEQLLAKFERINPDWRAGCSLPIIFAVQASMIMRSLQRSARRARRRQG